MPAILVEHLRVRRGTTLAVDDISFSVEPGEVVALLGPNGAGKTTTVETLVGQRRPDVGRVAVLGCDVVEDRDRVLPRIGVMPQQGGVYPGLRAREAVRLFASFYERSADPEAVLERVGLVERARSTWRTLSGGEQQRLSLALALVGRPEVAFLDEPTAGVDVQGRAVVRAIVGELRADGVAILLTTHELDDAERLADRIVIVDRGRVVAEGSSAALRRAGGEEAVRFAAPPTLDVAALGVAVGAPVVEVEPGEYRVDGPPSPALVARLTAWLAERDVPLGELRTGRATLEEVFLRLTGDGRP